MTEAVPDVPLAPDCAELRASLLAAALPPVWQLDAETARALNLEGNLRARAAWRPPVDTLAVDVADLGWAGLPPMRAYRPRDALAPLTMAWLHGGGWVLGGLETADAICRTLCHLTGWEIVSVDYRVAPWHPFPAAAEDALTATGWLLGERDRVAVGGDSAGGNLAAVVARETAGHPRVAGQVLVYPATDPALGSASAHAFVDGPFLTRRDMEWFYDQYLDPAERRDPWADLTSPPPPVQPAAVVLTVGHDPLRDEGIAYARALVAAGAAVEWIHAPELFHGAFTQAGVLPSAWARVEQVCAAAQRLFR